MGLDFISFVQQKLFRQGTGTMPADSVKTISKSIPEQEALKKTGIVSSDLSALLSRMLIVGADRKNLYTEIEKSLSHPLMSSAVEMYADTATIKSNVNNAIMWATSTNREYHREIEKLFDIINIEENIYDWAWTVCLGKDTQIPLLNDKSVTIKEMAENKEKYIGEKIWSINPQTQNLEVDCITDVFKTKENASIVRVWLDSGEYIDCTPEHPFMLRDGAYKEAKDLVEGESLMPHYRESNNIYNPGENKWYFNHELVLTKDFLEEYYVEQKYSTTKIAKMVGCDFSTILSYLRKFNIPVRGRNETKKGMVWSKERNLKISEANKGRIFSESRNKKISGKLKGRVRTEGWNNKISGLLKGQTRSEESKLKMSLAKKGKKLGKNSPNWKGGISPLADLIRHLDKYEDWVLGVFERDGYKCQGCGCGGKLMVHHESPFAVILQRFLENYSQFSPIEDKETLVRLAINYKPFWDISNGKTVCKECHKLEESHKEAYKVRGFLNHKVAKIEKLSHKEDVYDISIKKNHNFPTKSGVFVHNCCYGDLFVDVMAEPGVGIVSISDDDHPLNTSRLDYNGRLVGFVNTPMGLTIGDKKELNTPWSKVHLRSLGAKKRRTFGIQDPNYTEYRAMTMLTPDNRRLTSKYGTSILNNALTIYKRLKMAEDSLLMARINRSRIRYIYKIAIADGASPAVAASLVDEYVGELKRRNTIDIDGNGGFNSQTDLMNDMEDIILPVWGSADGLSVDKIGGEIDVKYIVDIEELRNQLATAIRIPLPMLAGYTKEAPPSLGDGALPGLDIRFSRQGYRIQRALISGVTRMVQIHLAFQGKDPDMTLFKIEMAETSTAAEKQIRESLDAGVDVVDKIVNMLDNALGSYDKIELLNYLNEKILKLNDLDFDQLVKNVENAAGPLTSPDENVFKQQLNASKTERKPSLNRKQKLEAKGIFITKPGVENGDLKAFLPERSERPEMKEVKINEGKDTILEPTGETVYEYGNKVWESKYKDVTIRVVEDVKPDKKPNTILGKKD